MTVIEVQDLVGPCAITLLSSIQMGAFARKVGSARSKYKIEPPAIGGNEDFQRIYRAHQNSVEFYPLFLGSVWTSSIMLHQVPASIFGLVYMYGRSKFFNGYVESAEKRIPGFKICIMGLQGLLICSVVGLANHGFTAYFGKSIWKALKSIC